MGEGVLPALAAWANFYVIVGSSAGALAGLQRDGRPATSTVLADWVWHGLLPLVAYAGLAGSALALGARDEPALFGVAAAAVLLLFVGIHDSWDSVTFIAVRARRDDRA